MSAEHSCGRPGATLQPSVTGRDAAGSATGPGRNHLDRTRRLENEFIRAFSRESRVRVYIFA